MGKDSQNSLEYYESSTEKTLLRSKSIQTLYEWEEVNKHNSKIDSWIVINNYVYDVTKFKWIHPGGIKILEFYAGQDATVKKKSENIMMPNYTYIVCI